MYRTSDDARFETAKWIKEKPHRMTRATYGSKVEIGEAPAPSEGE